MTELLTMLRLYSVQVILALAGLNTVIHLWTDAPGWLVLAVNVAGVVAGYLARRAPQPEVVARLAAVRAVQSVQS